MQTYEIENALSEVRKIKRSDNEYSIIDKYNNIISDVSERYTLLQNRDIMQPFINHFGQGNIKEITRFRGGKQFVFKVFTGREFNFNTIQNPDIVKEQIVIQNSYDKTKSFAFMYGAFRQVCANGLYSGNSIVDYRKIHVGKIPINNIIYNVFKSYKSNTFEKWQALKDVNLNIDESIEIINKFIPYEINHKTSYANRSNLSYKNYAIKREAIRRVNGEINADNQRNAWGVLNNLNRGISRALCTKNQINDRIKLNKKVESYLLNTFNIN